MTLVRKVRLSELIPTRHAESLNLNFFPTKKLKGIVVRGVENFTENFGAIARAIHVEGGNIVIMRPSSPSGEKVDILYYVECAEDVEETIASRIRELGIAEEILLIESPDERLALNIFFPYMVMDERAIIMREAVYSGLFNGLRELMKEGGAKTFLYMIGVQTGKEVTNSLKPILEGKSILESLETLALIAKALGYFNSERIHLQEEFLVFDIRDNWEAACLKKRYNTPQCYWSKGVLEGFLSELTGFKWKVEEKECAAMGNERCRFIIKRD